VPGAKTAAAVNRVPPPLQVGTLVRVPDRGDVFVRYQASPPGAPTVLLLHGWMVSADLNRLGTFQLLAGRCRVVAIDHRGHGRGIRTIEPFTLEDCADDTAGLLRELGLRDAVVAGYSMGGPVALLLASGTPTWCVAWCWSRPRPSWPVPLSGGGWARSCTCSARCSVRVCPIACWRG
jgi:pimeloyl-ACP methyl ester carboxylesterase